MTSLHSPPARTPARREPRRESELRQALVTRRPLVPTATLGGALAAAGPLLVCMALAVVGWFLTDAGGHGTPSGALRVGALGWLAAHGSGVTIEGIRVTAVPLGITLICAWSAWRVGHRVGESISGHGPDADRIADGERDWTVPFAGGLFTIGYVLVGVLAATLASTIETAPSTGRVVLWSVLHRRRRRLAGARARLGQGSDLAAGDPGRGPRHRGARPLDPACLARGRPGGTGDRPGRSTSRPRPTSCRSSTAAPATSRCSA